MSFVVKFRFRTQKMWPNTCFLLCVFTEIDPPVVERSKAWVCGRSLPGIVGSNPARFIIVCRCEGCVLRQARGVLPNVVCLSVIAMRRQWGGPNPLQAVMPWEKKNLIANALHNKLWPSNETALKIYQMNHKLTCWDPSTFISRWLLTPGSSNTSAIFFNIYRLINIWRFMHYKRSVIFA